jgi:hypothetical protein
MGVNISLHIYPFSEIFTCSGIDTEVQGTVASSPPIKQVRARPGLTPLNPCRHPGSNPGLAWWAAVLTTTMAPLHPDNSSPKTINRQVFSSSPTNQNHKFTTVDRNISPYYIHEEL